MKALRRIASCFTLTVLEIRWTEASEAHIAKHCVAPEEVEQMLNNRPQWVLGGEPDVTLRYATTDAGRHLLAVFAEALDGRLYVVTAREMTLKERRNFRRNGK